MDYLAVERFTKTERQIMALLADGLSNKEIGYRLHRSDLTIRNKISRMYTKAGLYGEGSRIKLIRLHYDLKEKA